MLENRAQKQKRQMVSVKILSITNQKVPFRVKCQVKSVFLRDVKRTVGGVLIRECRKFYARLQLTCP